MKDHPESRLFYTRSPKKKIVVQYNDQEIASYHSTEELVEVHIKGMMALDPRASEKIVEIYKGEKSEI